MTSKKPKQRKVTKVISLKWQKQHTKDGLVSWLESVKWEGSLDDALSLDGSLGDDALSDGVYALNYIWVNGNGNEPSMHESRKGQLIRSLCWTETLHTKRSQDITIPMQSQREDDAI